MPELAPQQSPINKSQVLKPAEHGHEGINPAFAQNPIIAQQKAFGNQAMQRMLQAKLIQAKLVVNPPDDEHEKEADQVEDMAMRMPESAVQRPTSELEKEDEEKRGIQTKSLSTHAVPEIQREMETGALRPKLVIGQPGDIYEREADRAADTVMSMPEPSTGMQPSEPEKEDDKEKNFQAKPLLDQNLHLIRREEAEEKEDDKDNKHLQIESLSIQRLIQREVGSENEERKREDEETQLQIKSLSGQIPSLIQEPGAEEEQEKKKEEPVKAKSESGTLHADSYLQQKLIQSKGCGRALPEDTRSYFESALGADFSNVNVHTGTDAIEMNKELGAQAFTHGSDIYFNAGKYDPASSSGRQLLAHELTHTVQQGTSALFSRKQTVKTEREYPNSDAPNVQAAWYNFHIPFTDYEFDPSIEGIKTATGLAVGKAKEGATWVKDRVVEGVEWIFDRISDLINAGISWLTDKFNEIKEFATSSFDNIKNALGNALAGIASPMALIKNAFTIMDAGALETAWNALSAGAKATWQAVKSAVNGVLAFGGGIWNTVAGYVNSLFGAVNSLLDNRIFKLLPDSLQSAARYLYNNVRSLWESIRDFWTKFWKRLTSFIHDLLASIEGFVQRVISYAINKVIAIIKTLKEVSDFITKLFTDPEAVIAPIIDRIAEKIKLEAPGKAKEVAQEKMNEAIPNVQAPASAGGVIQRKPDTEIERSTATRAEVNKNINKLLSDKLEELYAMGIRKMVWDTIVSMFYPPALVHALGREFYELWNIEWANAVESLFKPRNIFDDFGGFFHDLWSNILILLDFPLALWRRLNNILMLLMGYVTILLILAGIGFGGFSGGVPGALAGAKAGFLLAGAIGEALLLSFILAESSSVIKAYIDLYTVRQTKEGKDRDYLQFVASSIGIGIALVIAAIFYLLARLVSAVVAAIKGPKTPTPLPPRTTTDIPPETQPPGQKPPKTEKPGTEPRVIPGKLSLIQEIGAAQQRTANILERISNLVRGDRLALEARARAIEQRLTQMQERANAAGSERQVERLQSELDQVKRDLSEIEADPLLSLGLRREAIDSIETLERLKKDPVGNVNQVANKNHYRAARREAAGEVVKRRPDGRPYDHIRDLQESYNALDRVRRTLEVEQSNPSAGMTERGLETLLNKYAEVQAILSRLKGFLDQIGYSPPYPPFHEWPPGA